jgi:hypothetical protein
MAVQDFLVLRFSERFCTMTAVEVVVDVRDTLVSYVDIQQWLYGGMSLRIIFQNVVLDFLNSRM